jgi:L-alanine-DL-glutamate epimerase-like enolase superfamily enzyme
MKIVSAEARHYRLELPVVLSDAKHGDMTHFALVTCHIKTDDGVEGMGYTYTVGDIGGAATHALLASDINSVLIGMDPRCTEAIWEKLWWHMHFVGRGGLVAFAMAAADIACWDAKAKAAGEPLWRVLGGHNDRVMAYAGGIDLQFTLDDLLAQSRRFRENGFHAIKMKVGRKSLSEDVARVAAMRAELGDDFPLLADANMGWSVDEAVRAANAFAPHRLYWLEEPTIPDDIEGFVRICERGGVPIATGENFHTVYEFQNFISRGAVSFPEPDAATLGGITPWMKVARLAEAANLPVTSHGIHDIHVHLMAAVPNASLLEVHGFGLEKYIAQPMQLVDGEALAPHRPGHGVVFDFDAMASSRVDR